MKFELILDRISPEDLARGNQREVVTIPIKITKHMMRLAPGIPARSLAYFEARRIYKNNYNGWNFVGLIDHTGYRIPETNTYKWEDPCEV